MEMFPLLVLLLSLVPLSDSSSGPHLADLNVLLPPRMTNPVEYRLQGFNGCFSWSWGHHDILSVLPEYKGISWCSTSARFISIAPYSGRKETAVCAADLLSGTVICCNVFIDKIFRIQIFRHSDTVGLHGLTTLHVHAFDDKGNLFSSLVGLQFIWQLTPKSLETDDVLHHLVHIPLKDTPLSDCGSLCGDITTQIKLENSGVGSDLRVVKGAEIGHEIVSVHLLEPQLEHVADEIVLTIVEAISLDPPSPVFVIIGATIHYTLRVICQNTPQAIPLPSLYHRWSVSNTSVAQVDSTLGLAHALNLGITNVIVEDTRVAGDTQISSMHVVLPKKMSLYIVPVTISYEPLEGARTSTSTIVWNVVEGRLYVIYLKVFSDGPDMREIYITESDGVKLQCNGLLYWDTFIIPNAIAVKHGWKISCLIKATSQGLGRVTASLAYHSGNLERPKVITAVQEVMVCEKVKIRTVETNDFSRPIRLSLSPRISQEVVLTAAGGCGKRLNDYNWFSSDSAIVAVSAAGLVLANKPGLAIIKAASVFDSSNFDEISVHAHISSQNPVLHGHHLNFSIIGEGQTEETGVGYLSAASVPPETEDVITWILIIAAINGILINGMAFLDTPNGGRQKCGMTPADDSQSESNLLSPETPRPYVDYLRPLVTSVILGIPSSIREALKLSSSAYVISTVLMLPDPFKIRSTMWQLLVQQIAIYLETSVVSFYWEQTLHFFQVVSTRTFIFMPQQESAAPGTNPSEPLLAAIEQSTPRSIFQYCAYLDLCMISESNVETWRRAAFFEETGQTYRRVISVCLRPLEQLTSRLGEGLKGSPAENSDLLSQRLSSPMVNHADLRLHESFYDFQLCSWSARTVASLTARSRDEDRFRVARFTGCNAAVVSTLLSCLLAVEACLGKKTNPQSPHLLSPTNIWRATVDSGKRDFVCKKRESTWHEKAYGMADVLGASICQIISAFHDEMQKGAKAGILDKDWIIKSKPLHSTREILVHKLSLFLISKPTEGRTTSTPLPKRSRRLER